MRDAIVSRGKSLQTQRREHRWLKCKTSDSGPSLGEQWIEEGVERGRQQGIQEEQAAFRAYLLRVLERKFGPLSIEWRQRVESLPSDQLHALGEQLAVAISLAELAE